MDGRYRAGRWLRPTAHVQAISPALFAATLPANYPAMNVKHYLGFELEAISRGHRDIAHPK